MLFSRKTVGVQVMGIFLFIFAVNPSRLTAAVSGRCVNCHTMHNSEDNSVLNTGDSASLLRTTCVGCHSSSNGLTIVDLGGSAVPIVFNTGAYPAQPLAGGNFYHTGVGGPVYDQYGHNVYGIAGEDTNLSHVPGKLYSGVSKTITECIVCHKVYTNSPFMYDRPGNLLICIDCHVFPRHHADDSAAVVGEEGGWFRFLNGVRGVEDNDWEQTSGPADHNEYQGENVIFGGSVSDSGCMCHNDFHALVNPGGVGTASPWLRHPTDVALPDSGEYKAYTVYNPNVPVARPDLSGYGAPSSVVSPGVDQVACVSCHRAHGSDQPDMLRWTYGGMQAHDSGNPAAGTGCFVCHSAKDD